MNIDEGYTKVFVEGKTYRMCLINVRYFVCSLNLIVDDSRTASYHSFTALDILEFLSIKRIEGFLSCKFNTGGGVDSLFVSWKIYPD